MKKKMFFAMALLVCLTTGCGNQKKLVCTISEDEVAATLNVVFKDDKLNKMDFVYNVDLATYEENEIEMYKAADLCSLISPSFGDMADAIENCKQNVDNKSAKITADFNIKKLSEEDLKVNNSDEAKKTLEDAGYTCKYE